MPPLLLFCPYGIDTAEITAIVRELLHEVGLGIHWIMDPVKNCSFTGNHLGIQPHSFVEIVEMLADDCETITGIRPKTPSTKRATRSCSSRLPATCSRTPASTPSWAT